MAVKYNRWLRSYVGHQRIFQVRVAGFIRDDSGKVLLCRRADVMLWDLPGGTIELDETPATGLVRELRQETGLIIEPNRLIGVYAGHDFEWTYPNGDQAQIVSMLLEARVVDGTLHAANRENVQLGYFPPDRLPTLLPRTVRMVRDALEGRAEAHFD
ncbi:MAG: NUDIX domain-containing protein [Chloroflexaceae bacterium]|jgi:ADP-ribose pyrophosphatase YjhB (NUDIX family)|nr:NUDIX domain-containing protein [Chloroflexaceae bacterium]